MGTRLESAARGQPLPHRPTVYLLTSLTSEPSVGAGDAVAYVGQTQDLRVRIAQHSANPRMCASPWDRIHWFDPGIPDEHERLRLEALLICAVLPELNKAIMLVKNKQGALCQVRFGRTSALGRALGASRKE